ncbi:hypothetical protein NFI96_028064 [Prochilodus magdalenae]|nr:hypothetical protein NFI96_028064 [Prochilodus magdalenae]
MHVLQVYKTEHLDMQTAPTEVSEGMGRSQELSKLQHGTVIRCHLCNCPGVFSGVTNHASPSGSLMDESGFGADQETLDHSMLPTLWGQFGDGPFLFQHDRTPVHRASSIKTWVSESGVEELDWPAQSPDLHPIEHLWDELEWTLRARPSPPTSGSDLTGHMGVRQTSEYFWGRMLLRTALVLWLARLTLQGGTDTIYCKGILVTGYQPSNGGVGRMLMPSKGYGLGPQAANAYPPKFKGQGVCVYNFGDTGYGAQPPPSNGNGAVPNGYGAAQSAGPGGLANGADKMLLKGYGAASTALGHGAKPNGGRAPPAAVKGNGGYGAALGASHGQAAKPNGGIGVGMGPQLAARQRGGQSLMYSKGSQCTSCYSITSQITALSITGYGNGNGHGYKAQPFKGYGKGQGAYPQAGATLGGGNPNGAKAGKPGFGAGSAVQSGQGVKSYGNGAAAGTKGPKAGYGGYPNAGAVKGPKAGYGGYGTRPNGYGMYPNGGAKGPKPGYGVAGAGANNGQGGAKSNGYGVPAGVPKVPTPGYGPLTNGNRKGPKEASLGPQAPRVPVVPTYTKGLVPPAEPEPTRGVPSGPVPTMGVPSLMTNGKGPKPEMQPQVLYTQSQGPQAVAPQPVSVFPQGKPPKPIVQQPGQVLPQSKGPRPSSGVLSQGQVPVVPEFVPQGKAPKPAQPAPGYPFVPQGKAQKPIPQLPQAWQPAPVFPQGAAQKPFTPQQAVSQVNTQRPVAPAQVPVMPQSKAAKPAPVHQFPQTKGLKSFAPVAPHTEGPPPAPEPTQAMAQMKGPKAANSELAGLGLPNGQGAKPAKPDCGPGGVSGQWTKMPYPGFDPRAWYLNNGGAKASKSGPGGYGAKPQQPGYANGQGLLPATGYGYGNGKALVETDISLLLICALEVMSDVSVTAGETGQLPYNGAPIVPAGLDGTSQIQPQTAELGPEAKSGGAYGVPYGTQPMDMGSEGKSQGKYAGTGALPFAGSPMGYGPDPYGNYGNPYAAQPYGPKQGGKYGAPYNPKPLGLSSDPKSYGKYGIGGLPYGGQPLVPGGKAKSSALSSSGAELGTGGLPYGAQPLSLSPDAGKSGKYGQPAVPYAPEHMTYGGDVKSAGKYGQQALPYDSGMVGPVTDGQSVDRPALPYEALPPGPEIDGVKSVDQFGEGEIPPQPDAALLQPFGEGHIRSTGPPQDHHRAGPGGNVAGGLQPEAISFPAAPTADPASLPLVTAVHPEAGASSFAPLPQAEPPSPQLPSLMLQPVTPQQIHIQQQLKVHLHPQGKSWTGTIQGLSLSTHRAPPLK